MGATDRFPGAEDLLSPALNAENVIPSDTNTLACVSKRLWVGAPGGDVTVVTVGGQTVTYSSVPGGTYLPVRATQVKATGTTATEIVSEY